MDVNEENFSAKVDKENETFWNEKYFFLLST